MAVGRSDTLQELITILETMFGETIIGSDINLVKHLFYSLKADQREFPFDYEGDKLNAVVEEVGEDTLILYVPYLQPKGILRAKISFEILNILYQFEVVLLDFWEDHVRIKIPSELQAAAFRKNLRVAVDDLFMNYVILYRSLSGGERELGKNLSVEQKFFHLMKEIKKDNPSLKLINLMATEYILGVSKDYEIVFFGPGKKDDFLGRIMKEYNRSVYIQDCSLIMNYIGEERDPYLDNFRDEYLKLVQSEGQAKADEFFRDLQKEEVQNFMISYVATPIRLFNDPIGYIRVYSTAMDKFSIVQQQALYIQELGEILTYALTKVYIRQDNFRNEEAVTRILDISMNGLLFEIEDARTFKYLKKHNIIKMFVPISERDLVLRGEVVRFLELDDGKFHLGVNFFDSNPDDMVYLQNYIFGKKMRILFE
ncbi:PilZ domain-containing protein [Leptospira wolffii]|uniref:PilZ domain-containing protein n=1 Tax=Leptospira wolffii TaxID=409998 RepID=UPI0010837E2D|nr:PilZ domain-containing protein [Leptospira wolffii]TGK58327.1 PilZ domain-containing protein [Leptospira wolffii]TGK66296.1 PilZ domain-containing protein [Leptospira wolffii]TGK69005.1 PilZ domain-containing protein [Leptospira wolffii]TGL27357.1 PilZ domain-containing protein [Leptospira wolffii]